MITHVRENRRTDFSVTRKVILWNQLYSKHPHGNVGSSISSCYLIDGRIHASPRGWSHGVSHCPWVNDPVVPTSRRCSAIRSGEENNPYELMLKPSVFDHACREGRSRRPWPESLYVCDVPPRDRFKSKYIIFDD